MIYYCSLVALIATICFKNCVSQRFDENFTGVVFWPYIKYQHEDTTMPDLSSYTFQDIQTMLEVILGRFSQVGTWGTGSKSENYTRNVTYHTQSKPEVLIAEAAATINKEQCKKALTIQQGVWLHEGHRMKTEISLAFESVEKANQIFPGTVNSLVFSRNLKHNDASILEHLKLARRTFRQNLKLGVRMECQDVFHDFGEDTWEAEELADLIVLLQHSDFIVCEMYPEQKFAEQGPEIAFHTIGEWLLLFRGKLQTVNSRISVMGQVKWASEGKEWETVEYMKIYWETANQWARRYNFSMWLFEAFDYPYRKAHYGWWRLKTNWKINKRDGYIEKIMEKDPRATKISSMKTSVILHITVGSLLLVIVFFFIVYLVLRVTKLQQQLSDEDISQFIHGIPEDGDGVYEDDPVMVKLALQFSYDSSFEIEKDELKIQYDQMLGTGQFGCVFKAIIEFPDETGKLVALKVAKSECTRNALKGLLSEIKVLTYIGQHPNIVKLEGAYTAELRTGVVYIATEYCCLGSLQGYLREQNISGVSTSNRDAETPHPTYVNISEPISFWQMLQWSQEIACGMEYLGTKNVVHADLATRNVLLNEEKTAKICDFGLSKRMYEYTHYIKSEQGPLPWRWMAIESLNMCKFSSKSDIWGYGVTIWEIFEMGNIPYPGLTWTTNFVTMLVQGLRLPRPAHATSELFELMLDCWQTDPNERPSFSRIQQVINSIKIKYKNSIDIGLEPGETANGNGPVLPNK